MNKSQISGREYAELLVSELGKRTDEKFLAAKEAVGTAMIAAEKAVSAALVASDKLTSAAFIAAKEALKEAQVQLAEYKAASNEWRATLTELIAKGMLRPEIDALFKSASEKLSLLEARVAKMENVIQRNSGEREGSSISRAQIHWTFEKLLSVLAILIALATMIWHLSTK
jgi:hypothetical protein